MIKSMTGFGRSEFTDAKRTVTVEIRSVNHRYCDISVRMPRRYSFAEDAVKNAVKQTVRRGKAEVSVNVENKSDDDVSIRLNTAVAKQYMNSLNELRETLGLKDPVRLEYIASMPDVLKSVPAVEDEDQVTELLCTAVLEAAERHDKMRITEGARLAEDILKRSDIIAGLVKEIEERSPETVSEYAERLRERIKEMVGGTVVATEERILLEAAVFADKVNVTEETVRLSSHVKQLNDIITGSSQPDGKKLDFLVQEMNREANTIGSKANDIEITNRVLALKSEIEKIREQVQNIE